MLKFNPKIQRLFSYLVLVAYLSITLANIFHHHNVDIGKYYPSLSSATAKQISHIFLNGSEVFCPIQFAYNSLQNSIFSDSNPFQNYKKNPDVIDLLRVSPKPTKEIILHYSLRAPPKF